MDRIFKRFFLSPELYIAAPTELSISFLLDEKSAVVPVRLIHGFSRYSGVKRLRHIEAQHGLLIASLL
jgi:hypothetical protein